MRVLRVKVSECDNCFGHKRVLVTGFLVPCDPCEGTGTIAKLFFPGSIYLLGEVIEANMIYTPEWRK